jgi:hypothetical protein
MTRNAFARGSSAASASERLGRGSGASSCKLAPAADDLTEAALRTLGSRVREESSGVSHPGAPRSFPGPPNSSPDSPAPAIPALSWFQNWFPFALRPVCQAADHVDATVVAVPGGVL